LALFLALFFSQASLSGPDLKRHLFAGFIAALPVSFYAFVLPPLSSTGQWPSPPPAAAMLSFSSTLFCVAVALLFLCTLISCDLGELHGFPFSDLFACSICKSFSDPIAAVLPACLLPLSRLNLLLARVNVSLV